MQFNDFKASIERWATARDIYEYSTVQAQVLKAVSELGELADATIKNDREAFIDGVGDVMVCLVNASFMRGVDMHECMQAAWDAIKDRKGHMIAGGAFVKDE